MSVGKAVYAGNEIIGYVYRDPDVFIGAYKGHQIGFFASCVAAECAIYAADAACRRSGEYRGLFPAEERDAEEAREGK